MLTIVMAAEEIRHVMLNLCRRVQDLLSAATVEDRRRCTFLKPKVRVRETSSEIAQVMELNWGCVLDRAWETLLQTSELKDAARLLASINNVQCYVRSIYHRADDAPLSDDEIQSFLESQVIRSYMRRVVLNGEPYTWCDTSFSKSYAYWETLVLTGTDTIKSISLFEHFVGPRDSIELAPDLIVRKATDGDLTDIAQNWTPLLEPMRLMRHCWLLETSYQVPRLHGVDSGPALNRIRRLLALLRLLKSGDVACRDIFSISQADYTRRSQASLPTSGGRRPYQLTEAAEIDQLKSLWSSFRTDELPSGLNFALRRFNFGIERDRPEDRVIDYVIGLERLYVPDGGFGEIGYKLRMRAAAFLGRDVSHEQRQVVKNEVQVSYNVRSILVHGEEQDEIAKELRKLDIKNLEQLAELTEDLLRRSILAFEADRRFLTATELDRLLLSLGERQTGNIQAN